MDDYRTWFDYTLLYLFLFCSCWHTVSIQHFHPKPEAFSKAVQMQFIRYKSTDTLDTIHQSFRISNTNLAKSLMQIIWPSQGSSSTVQRKVGVKGKGQSNTSTFVVWTFNWDVYLKILPISQLPIATSFKLCGDF